MLSLNLYPSCFFLSLSVSVFFIVSLLTVVGAIIANPLGKRQKDLEND